MDKFEYTMQMEALAFRPQDYDLPLANRQTLQVMLEEYLSASEDEKPSAKIELENLCRLCGFHCQDLVEHPELIDTVPGAQETAYTLADRLIDIVEKAPDARAILNRTVRQLAPEFDDDSLEMAILKKFLSAMPLDAKTFDIASFYACSDKSEQWWNSLDESILQLQSEKKEKSALDDMDKFSMMIRRAGRLAEDPVFAEFDSLDLAGVQAELDVLLQELNLEKQENSLEMLAAVAKSLQESEDWSSIASFAPFFKGFSKTYRQQLKKHLYTTKSGTKKDAYALYTSDLHDARKALRTSKAPNAQADPNLIKLVLDLANGRFRPNGMTRRYLYYFAFVFDMDYSEEDPSPLTDINKNLFFDFYTDNMLRFLEDEYADGQKWAATYEKEPFGEGVNVKNYQESIYLWYLNHSDLFALPGERIDRANAMIEQVKKQARTLPSSAQEEYEGTLYFSWKVFDSLMEKSEDELADFICDHYLIFDSNSSSLLTASWQSAGMENLKVLLHEGQEAYIDEKDYFISMQPMERVRQSFLELIYQRLDARKLERQKVLFSRLESRLCDPFFMEYGYAQRKAAMIVLSILAKQDMPIYKNTLKAEVRRVAGIESEEQLQWKKIRTSVDLLKDMGFPISNRDDYFELIYDAGTPEAYMQIIAVLKKPWPDFDREDLHDAFESLLLQSRFYQGRVSRNQMLSAHFSYYIHTILDPLLDAGEMLTLYELIESYSLSANEFLDASRFASINAKSITDLYLISALYSYVLLSQS